MAYGFNEDMTRAEFVVVEDTGTITNLNPNTSKGYNFNLTRDQDISPDEYEVVGFVQTYSSGNTCVINPTVGASATVIGGSCAIWNLSSSVIGSVNVRLKILLVKK